MLRKANRFRASEYVTWEWGSGTDCDQVRLAWMD